ncbi:sensor histidine kinase [Aneurinibacillus sp. Ricciae_BoGa-3]|uniref:sensor histidine kinase n=1 Tax=Aneurinibacillus sp. Ricciae_BoGa-3 TaxID=3022697 RepID=UPI002340691B|nr:sensor histidine kinase [Aneurinibacillus sp. Ricciae_BoGa-3]WCK54215.1 sensor histidine kinase [Aneurinibacillus sp. Ricciae_BoGa-3]
MDEVNIDVEVLDEVFKKTVSSVEDSKEKIFDISENARQESNHISLELENLKTEINEVINHTDQLEVAARRARQQLAHVSRNFHKFNETQIREAYEEASQVQIQLTLSRDKELRLRLRRDELDRRLRSLKNTVEKADTLITHISVVLNYLQGDLQKVGRALESAQNRQQLGFKIIQAQEEERKRVAREIHDGPAQSMANVALRSEIVERMLNQNRIDEAKTELRLLKELTRASLTDVRKIIFDLRPMALDDLGLVPTLRKYTEDFQKRQGVEAKMTIIGSDRRVPSTIEVAIFRLIQESLNNVAKHAQARHVDIRIEFKPQVVHVRVIDDGVGFTPPEKGGGLQFGLMGMKERTKLLQGKMKVDSTVGKGTTLSFSIPLKHRDDKNPAATEKTT